MRESEGPRQVGVYTAAEVRAAEAPLLAAGVPLMRRAAAALARVVGEVVADALGVTELGVAQLGVTEQDAARVLVLAGAGDNGGDALYAAADLAGRGTTIDVPRTAERVHEAALAAAVAAGAEVVTLEDAAARGYDLVLDGILGIGARGGLRGAARETVAVLQAGAPRVIAVDIPSGLDPDEGTTDGVVLRAATTVTFGGVKAGLVRGRGPSVSGRVVLIELGLSLGDPVAATTVAEVRAG